MAASSEPRSCDTVERLSADFARQVGVSGPSTCLGRIRNAHKDDIHGFLKVRGGFLSGSKDASVCQWDESGEYIWSDARVTAGKVNYKLWATALGQFEDEDVWVSGWRDGTVKIYAPGCKAKEIRGIRLPTAEHICKQRNAQRIDCLATLVDGQRFLLVGTAQYMHVFDTKKEEFWKPLAQKKICENDWIYCIRSLSERDIAIVTGSNLAIWRQVEGRWNWNLQTRLVEEDREVVKKTGQRPHISALEIINQESLTLATACFDEHVRIIDVGTQEVTADFHGHEGRVWSVIKIDDRTIASSADDRTIKLWDLRMREQVACIDDHPGRVSSLLLLSDTCLISGSCPDRVFESRDKAVITFWDLRRS